MLVLLKMRYTSKCQRKSRENRHINAKWYYSCKCPIKIQLYIPEICLRSIYLSKQEFGKLIKMDYEWSLYLLCTYSRDDNIEVVEISRSTD